MKFYQVTLITALVFAAPQYGAETTTTCTSAVAAATQAYGEVPKDTGYGEEKPIDNSYGAATTTTCTTTAVPAPTDSPELSKLVKGTQDGRAARLTKYNAKVFLSHVEAGDAEAWYKDFCAQTEALKKNMQAKIAEDKKKKKY